MQLFADSLISSELRKSLPNGFNIRSLSTSDYEKGTLVC